ncbi:MAG: hypothetical protein JXR03_04870 [Cyclobacteriaceae bacterium]
MKNIHFILTALFIFSFITPMLAQPGAPPATPIDGGLSLLLAAGGAYGLKKLRDSKKKG